MIGDNMDLWNLVEILIYREQLWKINVLANSAGNVYTMKFQLLFSKSSVQIPQAVQHVQFLFFYGVKIPQMFMSKFGYVDIFYTVPPTSR